MRLLLDRLEAAEAVIKQHDLCHDLHGKVGRDEFEEGCRRETVKEYGSCGWADRMAELEAENARLRQAAKPLTKDMPVVDGYFWIVGALDGPYIGSVLIRESGRAWEERAGYLDEQSHLRFAGPIPQPSEETHDEPRD